MSVLSVEYKSLVLASDTLREHCLILLLAIWLSKKIDNSLNSFHSLLIFFAKKHKEKSPPIYLWKSDPEIHTVYSPFNKSCGVYMFRSTLEMNTHTHNSTHQPVKLILKHHNLTQIYKYSQAASQSPQSLPSNQNLKPFATIPTLLICIKQFR